MLFLLALIYVAFVHADIFSDVAGFFRGGFKNAKELAGKAWGAAKHILVFVSTIFQNVGGAWASLHEAFRTLITGLENLAENAYTLGRFLINTLVPKWARKAIADAINYAERNIKALAHKAVKLADAVKTWALKQLNRASDRVTKLFNKVTRDIAGAINWITKQGKKAANLVLHPGALVKWIMPHLVTPLARWILAHLEALAILIGRYLLSNIGKLANDLERALAKLF